MKKIFVEKFAKNNVQVKIAAAAIKGSGFLKGFRMNLENGFSCSIDEIVQVWNSKEMEFSLDGRHQVHSKAENGNAGISSKGSGESKLLVKGLKIGQGSNLVEVGEFEFDSLSEAVGFALQFASQDEGDYEVFKDK